MTRQPRSFSEGLTVRERLDRLQELAGAVDLPALGVWLGVPVQTMQKLTARGIARPTALRMIVGLKRHGYDASLEWLTKGLGWEPRPLAIEGESRGVMPTGHGPTGGVTVSGPSSTSIKEGEPLGMHLVAKMVAKAIEEDLHKSTVPVLLSSLNALEKQRLMIWALKDLARQLKKIGYNMNNLFHLTDDLAEQVGLPIRLEPPAAPERKPVSDPPV